MHTSHVVKVVSRFHCSFSFYSWTSGIVSVTFQGTVFLFIYLHKYRLMNVLFVLSLESFD